MNDPLDRFAGYSVSRVSGKWHVHRGWRYVGVISLMLDGRPGWDWHASDMWQFAAREFVTP